MLQVAGEYLARYLSKETHSSWLPTSRPEQLLATLRKGDILLVDGNTRFSTAIKYLTQSTWSHAALCIADGPDFVGSEKYGGVLLEADVVAGVRVVGRDTYTRYHTRICRPIGLSPAKINQLVDSCLARIGDQYDLRNVFDLARYLISTPPVPSQWRRRMLALGSGDPTRAICSSLIAQAFQSVGYPILPIVEEKLPSKTNGRKHIVEVLHIRHYSLYTPRDFDLSPYFQIIKPTLEAGFDPRDLHWDKNKSTAKLTLQDNGS